MFRMITAIVVAVAVLGAWAVASPVLGLACQDPPSLPTDDCQELDHSDCHPIPGANQNFELIHKLSNEVFDCDGCGCGTGCNLLDDETVTSDFDDTVNEPGFNWHVELFLGECELDPVEDADTLYVKYVDCHWEIVFTPEDFDDGWARFHLVAPDPGGFETHSWRATWTNNMGREIKLNSSIVEGIDYDVNHESQYPCDPDDFGNGPPREGLVLEIEPLGDPTPTESATWGMLKHLYRGE